MAYKTYPVKDRVDFKEGEVFGVRCGNSLEDAVKNLQYAVDSGLTIKAPEEAVICVYQVGKDRYEAVVTLFDYIPFRRGNEKAPPEVIVRDKRGKK